MRILIAEDDFTSRLYIQKIMGKYGEVHLAVNGKEVVTAVSASLDTDKPYDLICLDIMMPEMDGQTALKEIRNLEKQRGIISSKGAKIIMTTALDDLKNVSESYGSLCDSYLVKPIESTTLFQELKKLNLIT